MGTTQTLNDRVYMKVCSKYLLVPVVINASWNPAVLASS